MSNACEYGPTIVMRKAFRVLLWRPAWTVDVAHGGAGGVPGEESGVDPGEVGHITPAASDLGLDAVPAPGIQVGPGVRVGDRGVAHIRDADDESFLALLGSVQHEMVAGH